MAIAKYKNIEINFRTKNRGFSRRGTHPVRAPSRAPCWIFFGTTKYALILYLFYLRRSNLRVSERTYIIVPMV